MRLLLIALILLFQDSPGQVNPDRHAAKPSVSERNSQRKAQDQQNDSGNNSVQAASPESSHVLKPNKPVAMIPGRIRSTGPTFGFLYSAL
jgi:hypothetical protein